MTRCPPDCDCTADCEAPSPTVSSPSCVAEPGTVFPDAHDLLAWPLTEREAGNDLCDRLDAAEDSLREVQALNEELVGELRNTAANLRRLSSHLRRHDLPGLSDACATGAADCEAALLKATPHRGGEGKQGLTVACAAESGREAAPSSAPGRDGGES